MTARMLIVLLELYSGIPVGTSTDLELMALKKLGYIEYTMTNLRWTLTEMGTMHVLMILEVAS